MTSRHHHIETLRPRFSVSEKARPFTPDAVRGALLVQNEPRERMGDLPDHRAPARLLATFDRRIADVTLPGDDRRVLLIPGR
jgi:hypothetical protein